GRQFPDLHAPRSLKACRASLERQRRGSPLDYRDLRYTEDDGGATITIERPKVYNAFPAHACEELIHAFQRAAWNKDIGVVVLTGAGDKAFCTGGDQSSHAPQGGYGGRGTG